MLTTLITPEQLAAQLHDPDLVIVDCRFELLKPDWGRQDYQRAHVPGAVFADLNQDLSVPISPTSGRHPLPQPEAFCQAMSRMGIDSSKQVVVMDTVAGAFAARLWWLLRTYGHTAVAVLEGGFSRWEYEKYPLETGDQHNPPSNFTGRPDTHAYYTTRDVENILHDPAYCIIDARAAPRYRGETEPIDPVAGHIPGAVNRFHVDNLSHGGRFLDAADLRTQFTDLLHGVPPENAVVYCGSGVTSCFHILAMEIAGLTGAKLYPGSWSEWIRDPQRPIALSRPSG